MNRRLDQDSADFKVLFLPWHLYMYFRFADRIIANPARDYFDKPVFVSNNLEYMGASPTFPDADKSRLNIILASAADGTHLGRQLTPLHIKYVLLDKDADYRTYGYLDQQADLRLVESNLSFRLYVNRAFQG